jgi:threonine/homoserine/homoserine lactone efflux protein
VAVHFLIGFVRRATRAIRWMNMGAGVLLIATGVLLITDKLRLLSYLSF